jgi:hypothetical protein
VYDRENQPAMTVLGLIMVVRQIYLQNRLPNHSLYPTEPDLYTIARFASSTLNQLQHSYEGPSEASPGVWGNAPQGTHELQP